MPKKKTNMDQAEQSLRFLQAARAVGGAGDVSPTEVANSFDKLLRTAAPERRGPSKS